MKSLKRRIMYAMGATALGMSVSMTPVQADVVTVNPLNISCADLEAVLGNAWPSDMKVLFQVVAANEYGAAVTGNGGNFSLMCGGSEVFQNNTMENLTASTGDTELDITPVYIEIQLVGGAAADEDISVSVQGDTVVVDFVVDDATEGDTRARRNYSARISFNGSTRHR